MLRDTAEEAFSDTNYTPPSPSLFSDLQSGIDKVNAQPGNEQVSAMQSLSWSFFQRPEKFSGIELRNACRAVIDWHLEKIKEPGFSRPDYIISNLERSLANIGCHAHLDEHNGLKKDDALELKEALTSRTLSEIETAKSGCFVDTVINNYQRALTHMNLKMDYDTRLSFISMMDKRTEEAVQELNNQPAFQEMWRAWAPAIREKLMRYQKPPEPSLGMTA